MRINPFLVPGLFIVALIGTMLIAQFTGGWIVSGRTTVETETLAITDIKGWMTLQQVIDGVHISQDELYTLVGLPADIPASTPLKDLEKLVEGFETSTLRDALTAWSEDTQSTPSDQATE